VYIYSYIDKDPEDLYQVALLIDQLKHDDVQFRMNASRSLTVIAQALGPERTRDELLLKSWGRCVIALEEMNMYTGY
jgi:hypothetical protein